jgi:hypothetical protein
MSDNKLTGVAEVATRFGLRQGYLAGYEQAMHDMCMLGMLGYERPRECWNWLRNFLAGELDQWSKSIDPGEVPRFTFPPSWSRQRSAALARDGGCVDCGRVDGLECDHIKPVSDGGYGTLTNLCARCSTCHLTKTRAKSDASAL